MSGEPGPITFRIATAADTPEIPAVGAIALAGFLESLRVPLVTGRYFAPEDDDRPVAIVDTLLAERLWGRDSPLDAGCC